MSIEAKVSGGDRITATVDGDRIVATVSAGGPQGPAGADGASAWEQIVGKPTVFPAAPHQHAAEDIVGGTLDPARLPATVVLTTDARLADAREWSAATVTQAEAEAGAATDRRAFTVQRVWQAIAAWWVGSAAKAKLDGIAAGATANATDAQLRDRATHTGTQAIATVSGLQAALDGKAASAHTHTASAITDFAAAVVAAAPPTTDASLLTQGTLPDARLSSNIARTGDITNAVSALVDASPAALDTLNELAAALGDDANFATSVTNALADKAAAVHTHTVSAITDAGTAATRNVPTTGNASETEVVIGSDTRLTDSRTPTAHSHGFISFDGRLVGVGGVAISPHWILVTGVNGVIGAVSSISNNRVSFATNDRILGRVTAGPGTGEEIVCTAAGRALLDDATATDQRTTLGLGTAATASASDFAASVHTHAASDIVSGTLSASRLPIASSGSLGGVRIGSGISIDGSGVISASSGYTLPIATANTLGGVKIGSGITITDGVISVSSASVAWNDITSKPSTFAPSAHAASHAVGGADGLTPADIGAAAASDFDQGLKTTDTVAFAAALVSDIDGVNSIVFGDAGASSITFGDASIQTTAWTGTAPAHAASHAVGGGDEVVGLLSRWRGQWDEATHNAGGYSKNDIVVVADVGSEGLYVCDSAQSNSVQIPGDSGFPQISTSTLVVSVAGKSGVVSLVAADVGAAEASHSHGSITSAGAIGTTSGLVLKTGADGVIEALAQGTAGQVLKVNSGATGVEWVTLGSAASASTSDFAAASHNHAASAITSGTLDIARIPTGTSSTTVCIGNDARLSDTRTPTAGSVTDSSITSGGLSASSINWVAIQPWAANTAYAKGDLVSFQGVAYRRTAQGTSGAAFNASMWQQVTPSEFVGSQITSGTINQARLGSGTANNTTFLRGDGTWAAAGSTNASDLTSGTLAYARMADPTVTSPSQIAANQNNYASFARGINRFTTDAARDITGMVAGADGEVRVLCNVGTTAANTLTIKDESSSSTAANRFSVPWNSDCVIQAEGSVVVFYDGTSQRWRVL